MYIVFHLYRNPIIICNLLDREFDENLLRKIFEISYEDEIVNLPYAPDVGDYLISEVCFFFGNVKP